MVAVALSRVVVVLVLDVELDEVVLEVVNASALVKTDDSIEDAAVTTKACPAVTGFGLEESDGIRTIPA